MSVITIGRQIVPDYVHPDDWAGYRGISSGAARKQIERNEWPAEPLPSRKHQGKTVRHIALHRLPEHQGPYHTWRVNQSGGLVESAVAKIQAEHGQAAAQAARERYDALRAWASVEPKTVLSPGGGRSWAPAVTELSQRLGIGPRTLSRWATEFGDGNFAALIPGRPGQVVRGDDKRVKLYDHEELLIQGLWAKRSRPDVASVFEQVTERCLRCEAGAMRPIDRSFRGRYKLHRCPECGFALSYATVRRVCERIAPAAAELGRRGPKAYDDHFARYAARDWQGVERSEVVYGDHHQLDVFVWDPREPCHRASSRPRLFRPWISAWQDIASSVVAWRTGERPNARLLSLAYRAYVMRFGVPDCTWCDNGKDYISEAFKQLCGNIGTELRHTLPSRRGGESHAKSKPIERWFGTLADFIRSLPGACGHSAAERPDDLLFKLERSHAAFLARERQDTELLSIDQLTDRISAWTEEKFHTLPTARQGRSPLEAFARSVRPLRTVSERALDILLMEAKTRQVGRNGVSVDGKVYWSRELFGHEGKPCKVLRDPGDVSAVVVLVDKLVITATVAIPAGTTKDDIKRERQLKKEQRQVVEEALRIRQLAAAGVRPIDEVLLEKATAAKRPQLAVAMAGAIPVVTPAHHVAAALRIAPASCRQDAGATVLRPRVVTTRWEAEHERD